MPPGCDSTSDEFDEGGVIAEPGSARWSFARLGAARSPPRSDALENAAGIDGRVIVAGGGEL